MEKRELAVLDTYSQTYPLLLLSNGGHLKPDLPRIVIIIRWTPTSRLCPYCYHHTVDTYNETYPLVLSAYGGHLKPDLPHIVIIIWWTPTTRLSPYCYHNMVATYNETYPLLLSAYGGHLQSDLALIVIIIRYVFVLAGEIQAIVSLMDATAVGYDLTITPTDERGNVGLSKILTVILTGTACEIYFLLTNSIHYN